MADAILCMHCTVLELAVFSATNVHIVDNIAYDLQYYFFPLQWHTITVHSSAHGHLGGTKFYRWDVMYGVIVTKINI